MLKLKSLKIHKFPRVLQGTELVFNDGYNVLLGVNGSGKTTLLELIARVFNGSLGADLDDEVQLAYRLEDGPHRWDVAVHVTPEAGTGPLAREPQVRATVDISGPGGEACRVVFDADDVLITIGSNTTRTRRVEAHSAPLMWATLLRLMALQTSVPEALYKPLEVFWTLHTSRMEESSLGFKQLLRRDRLTLSQPASDQPFRRENAGSIPTVAVDRLCEQLAKNSEEDHYLLSMDGLPFLKATVESFGYLRASMDLELLRRDHHSNGTATYEFGNTRFRFTKPDNARITDLQLSFGQQRMLAFFYYSALHPHAMIIDELCNGMHHSMIDRCFDEIGERQAFLATQSPLLVDHLGFESADEVQRTFILCTTALSEGREHMVWRNMTTDEAEQFFRDYKVGVSHVNEILRSWGFW